MSFLDWFRKKKQNRYKFSQEDSDLGNEIKSFKQELKRLQYERQKIKAEMELEKMKADMSDLKEQLYGSEEEIEAEDSPEKMITNMLMMQMLKHQGNGITTNTNTDIYANSVPTSTKRVYSNQELLAMKGHIPKRDLKKAKKMSADELMLIVRNQLPDADEDSIARAISIIQE